MKYLLIVIILFTTMGDKTIFDFNKNTDASEWQIVDDVVMGGRSSGHFSMNEEGQGVFEGEVSLENNGGFSSVQYRPGGVDVSKYSQVVLRLKGDGKDYQFRVKHSLSDRHSYITTFSTSGEWEEIEIPLEDMYPSFRGRKLNIPDFDYEKIEEVVILIANKKPQDFRLLLDKITLE